MIDSIWALAVWLVGAYATFRFLKFLYIVTLSVYGHFICKPLDLQPYQQLWTIVTGGTDGIGRAYVEELARARGLRKFFLIGRNLEKLDRVRQELEERYSGCEVRTAHFDFETNDYDQLPVDELKALNIGILVNCAGIAPKRVAGFAELPDNLASKILRVNLMSNVKMIELILPGMIRRNFGIVVNFSSVTGWRPLPYMSSYPASKAAISFFSDALHDELYGTGVHVQCLIPLLVATKIASYDTGDSNFVVIDASSYARQAVNVIGRWRISTGCFLHDLQIASGTLIGFWLFKQLFVPLVMLGIHRKRVDDFQQRRKASAGNN